MLFDWVLLQSGGDPTPRIVDNKPKISEELQDKMKSWELAEILNAKQCRVASMPDTDSASKVQALSSFCN